MQGLQYNVDIVMCIDATGSMSPIIDRVKANALRFYDDLMEVMLQKAKHINTLRVRVIAFRDFYFDKEKAIEASAFFELPAEQEQFKKFVDGIVADGGGDEPENGLEALAMAIRSEWNNMGEKRRQIIVVWTDASTHPLELHPGAKPQCYPPDMPADFDQLTDMWEAGQYISSAAKRLIIYSPDAYAWTDIANYWENTIHYPSKAGEGLSELDYQTILDAIANSV